MKVKEIIFANFPTISPKAGLTELINIFLKERQEILPVVDENKKLVGIVELDDLIKNFMPSYFDLLRDYSFVEDFGTLESAFLIQPEIPFLEEEKLILVADLMKTKVFSIPEETSLLKAASLMNTYKLRYLPVTDIWAKFKGILTYTDLILSLFRGKIIST